MSTTVPILSPPVSGGPLNRIAHRLGLVSRTGSSVAFGLVLGVGLWLVEVLPAQIEGVNDQVWTLASIAGHVRLLLVIPLFFLAESLFEPRAREWLAMLVHYRIVPESEQPRFTAACLQAGRLRSSWVAELLCLGVVVALSIPGLFYLQFGATASYDGTNGAQLSLTAAWYWFVCLGVFRFLILRWLWHLCVWSILLWRISRLPLRLIPTHPDRAGGLGFLDVVQAQLLPLVAGISALHSAAIAEEVAAGIGTVDTLAPTLLLSLGISIVLLVGPMVLFVPTLWRHRVDALRQYMGLAAIFVDRFHQTWATPSQVSSDELVNTGQWSSLADMASSVNVVREMRRTPFSSRLLTEIMIAALVPALPLLLLKYPVSELATKVFAIFLGL